MTLVQQHTGKISTSSIFTYKGLIYRCRYECAHLCVQEGPSGGGFMVLWSVLYGHSSWIGSLPSRVVSSGHVCPGFGVTKAMATAIPLSRSLNTPGPPRQLSASLSWNAQKMFLWRLLAQTDAVFVTVDLWPFRYSSCGHTVLMQISLLITYTRGRLHHR